MAAEAHLILAKRLLQYFSENSRWIHNFDKRFLNPFYEKRCLACNFEKKCLQVIFQHARWAPNFAEWQLTSFQGKKFYKSNILYQRSFIMYIIDLFYTGDPFLFENYGVYVGKRVYFMYLDKERERERERES